MFGVAVWIFDRSWVISLMTLAVVGLIGWSAVGMGMWGEEVREMGVVDFPCREPFGEFAFEGWEMMINKGILS